jgi:hypothetical protein
MKNQSCAEDLRKKIENYSYGLKDWIGKGYSSVVFKGINDETSNHKSLSRGNRSHQGRRPQKPDRRHLA